jgi:hypothetical protein
MPVMAKTEASASISTNDIYQGDSFILTVEVNDTGSEYQFNTNELSKDFTVSRPSRSQQTTYINGEFAQNITWSVRLQANKVGTFTIPSFTLGDAKTNTINIEVKKATKQQQSTSSDTIFIENTLDKDSIYPDQTVTLESKIYVSENVIDGDIQAPTLTGAKVERVEKDLPQSQVIRNGLRYQIFTYQYKITPTSVGTFNISSPLLVGAIRKSVRGNNWQNNVVAQPINIRGNELPLTVKAMPDGFEGDWLISEDVRLIENNDLQAKEYAVGDPITRSISLQVAGIALEKMPEINPNYDSALRYYPDQDDLKQGTINNILYSQRTITHAIIANKSGELVLPEIKVAWWNSKTETQEFATLPAQSLMIKAAPSQNNNVVNQSQPVESNQAELTNAATNQGNNGSTKTNNNDNLSTQLIAWQISTLVLLVLLILLILSNIYYYRNKHKHPSTEFPVQKKQDTQYYQNVINALKNEDANATYASLLRYFQSQQSTVTLLSHINNFTGLTGSDKQQFIENLQQLELACSGNLHQWDAKQLQKLIKLHHKATITSDKNHITKLNP